MKTNESLPTKRGKINGYSHAKADAKADRKRLDAQARDQAHADLTPAQKLAKCRARRGCSDREVKRLTGA